MAEVSPIENPEELQDLPVLAGLQLTDEQKAVDQVAVGVMTGCLKKSSKLFEDEISYLLNVGLKTQHPRFLFTRSI